MALSTCVSTSAVSVISTYAASELNVFDDVADEPLLKSLSTVSVYASDDLRAADETELRDSAIRLERKPSQYDLRRPDLYEYRLIDGPALQHMERQLQQIGIDNLITLDKTVLEKESDVPMREFLVSTGKPVVGGVKSKHLRD